jgi:hypothetical protein
LHRGAHLFFLFNFSTCVENSGTNEKVGARRLDVMPELTTIQSKGYSTMQSPRTILCIAAVTAILACAPASADTMRSGVAFNNGIGQKTATQPADGNEVAYRYTLQGGDLDGCVVDVVEQLFPREDGAWGIYVIAGDVACDDGGFAYDIAGAWDGNGFHGAGAIEEGSGSGAYEGVSGRVAQINTAGKDAGDGTYDLSYDLVFDMAAD